LSVIFFASNKAEAPDIGGASASQMDALFIKNKVMVSTALLYRQTKAPRGLIPGPIFDRKTVLCLSGHLGADLLDPVDALAHVFG
jgi:hypothetical protein